jgi:nucleoporin NUP82
MSLGSGLIALSSSGQVATIDIDDTVTPGATVPESILPKAEPTSGVDTQCLLLTSPFDFVKTLAQVKQPYEYTSSRSALLSLPSARSASNTINNDITRAIIAHISSLHKHIQAVRSESMALERHLDLQVQEYQRQLAVLKRCTEQVAELKQRNVADRVKEMEMQQKSLNERTDKVIKDMQADIKPKAGAVEKRWFKEVLDLEGKVKGKSGTSGAGKSVSLEQRVKVVRLQYTVSLAAADPCERY